MTLRYFHVPGELTALGLLYLMGQSKPILLSPSQMATDFLGWEGYENLVSSQGVTAISIWRLVILSNSTSKPESLSLHSAVGECSSPHILFFFLPSWLFQPTESCLGWHCKLLPRTEMAAWLGRELQDDGLPRLREPPGSQGLSVHLLLSPKL